MVRWITKNGKHIPITQRTVIRSSDLKNEPEVYTLYRNPRYGISRKTKKSKPTKKWYEEGWRKEIYKFQETDYAIDLGNFGNYNFSFSVRKGNKEIFTVPKSLIKNAISCGFSLTTGVLGCPFDVPISAIEYAIKLYDQFSN